ncbi:MAG: glycosyltransferase [Mariprofundus sp.]|nr:glycosyltransferase [Mariprofundus sp.]
MTKKILFVAMQSSPHTARWIDLIADQGWDLHLFPVNHLPVIRQLRGVTVHQPWFNVRPRLFIKNMLQKPMNLLKASSDETDLDANKLVVKSIYPLPMISRFERVFNGFKYVRLGESEANAPFFYGPSVLKSLIKQLKPDLIHSMEFQHCGYKVLRTKELYGDGDFPKWLATNWGSDIYFYRNFEDHRKQISRLLGNIDYYSCECNRDVVLAQEMGLSGKVMPVLPNTGGFDLDQIVEKRNVSMPSSRRLIMVKGYQHFAGRALTALKAIARCADVIRDYRVVIFSPSAEIYPAVDELRFIHQLDIHVIPYAEHEKMLSFFAGARVYLGVSISDAISTSMLEAMAMGAFPIQTNTACCEEWIEDGKSGYVIPHDDDVVIADRLRKALTDDQLVDDAFEHNWSTVVSRLDKNILREKVIHIYDDIFSSMKSI